MSGGSPSAKRDDVEPDDHTRHDPEARSSREADRLARGPELPLREDDEEGPPGLNDDSDADETVEHGEDDFRNADSDDEEESDEGSDEEFGAPATLTADAVDLSGAAAAAVRQAEAEGLTLQPSDNTAGYRGVFQDKESHGGAKPFHAVVRRAGKQVKLGRFATAEEAALAYARTPEAQERRAVDTRSGVGSDR